MDEFFFERACKDAVSEDVTIVVAAGNSNVDAGRYIPARFADVITVAASDYDDRKASFSNYGGWVDIAAPGKDIISAKSGGGYTIKSGTSMATPYVAAAAAMLIQDQYWLTPSDIKYELCTYAVRPGVFEGLYWGAGILDLKPFAEYRGWYHGPICGNGELEGDPILVKRAIRAN